MESPRIFISTSNFKSRYKNSLDLILKSSIIEYPNLEIASGHVTSANSYKLIRDLIKQGKNILFHNYSFREENNLMINLCEADSEKRIKIISYIKEMILYTKEIGENYYSIHGGFYPTKLDERSKLEYNSLFINGLSEVIEFASNNGIYVGVENHVVEKHNVDKLFLYNEEQFEEMFLNVENPYLMLHLDLGHLKVSSETFHFNPIDFIDKFSDRIITIHIHENNSVIDKHDKFNNNSYFLPHLKKLKYLKNIVIETWDQSDEDINGMVRSIENVL